MNKLGILVLAASLSSAASASVAQEQDLNSMTSTSNNITGRDLLTPDEIMQLPPHLQLLRVQGQPTAVVAKLRYYADPEFNGLFDPQDQ